jgi:hypothetical protein
MADSRRDSLRNLIGSDRLSPVQSPSDRNPRLQRTGSRERDKFTGGLARTWSDPDYSPSRSPLQSPRAQTRISRGELDQLVGGDGAIVVIPPLGRTPSTPETDKPRGPRPYIGRTPSPEPGQKTSRVSHRGRGSAVGSQAASAFLRTVSDDSIPAHGGNRRKQESLELQERYAQEARATLAADAEDLEWLRVLDQKLLSYQWYISGLAVGGFCIAVAVSEMCGGDGCPSWANAVKAVISVCTLTQVVLMLRQMFISTEYSDTQALLLERRRGIKNDLQHPHRPFLKTFEQHWFLLLVSIPLNLIHPIPGLSGTVVIEQLGKQPRYQIEALIAGAMVLRIYHIFYLFRLQMITKYLALDSSLLVRNQTAIKQLNDPLLSQSKLALKIALERQPGTIILMMWAMLIFSSTYYIRVSVADRSFRNERALGFTVKPVPTLLLNISICARQDLQTHARTHTSMLSYIHGSRCSMRSMIGVRGNGWLRLQVLN